MPPAEIHVSRSLRKTIAQRRFRVTIDHDFNAVVAACAGARREGGGTWITADMTAAYERLFRKGHAHSVECWQGDELVGGLYGVSIGLVFFGESMFSRARDASKVALVKLCDLLKVWGYVLIDCQVHTQHLQSMGAYTIPRKSFATVLENACSVPAIPRSWSLQGEDA